MRKIFSFGIIAATFLVIASCGKDNTGIKNTGHPVEYKIVDADNSITQITYTDSSGFTNIVNSISEFNGGDTTIYIRTRPFIAHLAIEVNNVDNITKHYTLAILDSGVITKYQPLSVAPNSINTTSVTDTIH